MAGVSVCRGDASRVLGVDGTERADKVRYLVPRVEAVGEGQVSPVCDVYEDARLPVPPLPVSSRLQGGSHQGVNPRCTLPGLGTGTFRLFSFPFWGL